MQNEEARIEMPIERTEERQHNKTVEYTKITYDETKEFSVSRLDMGTTHSILHEGDVRDSQAQMDDIDEKKLGIMVN